jgi:acyl dehydratase
MSEMVFEDFVLGETYELGEYTPTKREIIEFAERWDPQPFHVDEASAQESLFGELVASGWHTAAILCRIMVRDLFCGVATGGGLGVDDLRWPTPVRPGDTLSGAVRVLETRPSESRADRGYVDFETTLENQHGETVCSMVNHSIILTDSRDD